MVIIIIKKYESIECACNKCGYSWIPLNNKPPKVCPKCKSYKWNVVI